MAHLAIIGRILLYYLSIQLSIYLILKIERRGLTWLFLLSQVGYSILSIHLAIYLSYIEDREKRVNMAHLDIIGRLFLYYLSFQLSIYPIFKIERRGLTRLIQLFIYPIVKKIERRVNMAQLAIYLFYVHILKKIEMRVNIPFNNW